MCVAVDVCVCVRLQRTSGLSSRVRVQRAFRECARDAERTSHLSPPPMHALRQVILSLYGVAGHTWQDVTFEYSTWYQPNTNDGFVDLQVLHHSV